MSSGRVYMMTIQLHCDYVSGTNKPIEVKIVNDSDDSVIASFVTNRAHSLEIPVLTTLYHVFDCTSGALDVYIQLHLNVNKTNTIFTTTTVIL